MSRFSSPAQKTTYNYPSDLGTRVKGGQHYMLIESFESRNAVDTGTTVKSSIALYIPPNALKTSFTQNYEGLEGAGLKASTGAGLGNLGNDFFGTVGEATLKGCLLYTSPSPRDKRQSRMPSSA